ncbi:glycosyltransferase family 4 protein [Luteimonas abyssi]|uniref:glycosyltransferase family 4 protein n=1 Tax=Luteimonas abyssi TaxID=1247514 RepID=UPI000737C887|nr:glycosyltransferase family 1 protein [Luteimonas abyssi]
MRIVVDLQACQFNGRFRGIGRYSLNLFEHMLDVAGSHEIIVCLNEIAGDGGVYPLVERLSRRMPREHIRTWASMPGIATTHDRKEARVRQRHACLLRDAYLASLKPDVIHTASLFEGFGDDTAVRIASPEGLASRTAVTLYDLIPLVRPAEYLQHPLIERWYRERIEDLRAAGMLLAISEASRNEAIEHLGAAPDDVAMISSGVDPVFSPWRGTVSEVAAFRRRFGLSECFALYTGGFDSRKNLARLVRAWAKVTRPEGAQLVFAGLGEPTAVGELKAIAAAAGLPEGALNFVGYVSDEDLVRLYSVTSVFAFPSFHEGFGLPILEAMACGAPVVAANATSLPEVVGLDEALFDPMSEASIAEKLDRVLNDPAMAERLRRHAGTQSRRFSWERSARSTLTALEALHARQAPRRFRVTRIEHAADADTARLDALARASSVQPAVADAHGSGEIALVIAEEGADDTTSTTLVVDGARWEEPPADPAALYATHGYAFALARHAGKRLDPAPPAAWVPPPGTAGVGVDAIAARRIALSRDDIRWPSDWRILPTGTADAFATGALALAFEAHASGSAVLLQRLVARVNALPDEAQCDEADLQVFAKAAANNHATSLHARQILVDVSELVHQDQATGIQRVVRRVLSALLDRRMPGTRVEPVYFAADGQYRYAAAFTARFLGFEGPLRGDDPIDYARGDLFLGLDLAQQCVIRSAAWFERLRAGGVEVHFVIYDLLPWLRSEFFHPGARPNFEGWLRALAAVADGVICISRAVADEFIANLEALVEPSAPNRTPLKIGFFHLGADLDADVSRRAITAAESEMAAAIPGEVPVVLMVSTLEPRKGYQQALDAFDVLWRDGEDVVLTIVGKRGWMFDAFAERLRSHPQWMRRLFWFEAASDGLLQSLYVRADVLLAASEGEGFGLPLIEAAQLGVPLLCRDIPVFREVAGAHAAYFTADSGAQMARAIHEWLGASTRGEVPLASGLPWETWQSSTQQLLDVVLHGNWYAHWNAGNRWVLPAFCTRFGTQVGALQRSGLGTTGEAGLLLHGPYIRVVEGRHRLLMDGRHVTAHGSSAWAEVVHSRGQAQVARFDLAGQTVEGPLLDVEFVLDDDVHDLEVRIWVGEGDALWMSRIVIERCDATVVASVRYGEDRRWRPSTTLERPVTAGAS